MGKFIKVKKNELENTCEFFLNEKYNNINIGENNKKEIVTRIIIMIVKFMTMRKNYKTK